MKVPITSRYGNHCLWYKKEITSSDTNCSLKNQLYNKANKANTRRQLTLFVTKYKMIPLVSIPYSNRRRSLYFAYKMTNRHRWVPDESDWHFPKDPSNPYESPILLHWMILFKWFYGRQDNIFCWYRHFGTGDPNHYDKSYIPHHEDGAIATTSQSADDTILRMPMNNDGAINVSPREVLYKHDQRLRNLDSCTTKSFLNSSEIHMLMPAPKVSSLDISYTYKIKSSITAKNVIINNDLSNYEETSENPKERAFRHSWKRT